MAMTPLADRTRSWVPRRALLRALGASVLGGLAAGCATIPVTSQAERKLVSEEAERNPGKEAPSELSRQQGVPLKTDPATHAYLGGIVRKVHNVSHRATLPVELTHVSAAAP